MMRKTGSAQDPLWFKDAILYELHVRTFFDSNNDGIGDFQGLIQKLDYLQDLGVTCLWLLPFFPSPLRDDGYDIAGYTSVHPSYGTLEDFQAFLRAAHSRGLQVMIELVVNHTSDQHPWFQAARHAPPGSPERDFYVWSDTDDKYDGVRIIFTDTESSNWTWDPVAKAYYWHRFFSHQPDLNYDNPAVVDKVVEIMRFWLDMGVDGLRLDAIPYLIERDGTNCENLPETHAVIRRIRQAMDETHANRAILAEANQWPTDVRAYFGDGDECHMAFHFPVMPRLFMGLRLEDRHPITDIIAQTPDIPENCQWGIFLRNHDELTLEMVTDEERDYMYMAYSADPQMRINIGIRRRLAPLMDNNRRRIELLNSLLFSFPGTPILYYGDEIGMGDNIYLGDRNGVRTPMQWSADRNAGFSRVTPARLYSPVIMDAVYGHEALNVEAQQSDASSLLNWMRNMIALRKLFQVFGRGSIRFLAPANRKILAYLRSYKDEQVLCVANLSRFAQPVELDLAELSGVTPVEMLGYVEFPKIGRAPYPLTLGPYGFLWFELHGAPDTPEEGRQRQEWALTLPPGARVRDLFETAARSTLESRIFPAFLPQQRWFGSKTRRIRTTHVKDWTALEQSGAALSLVEVEYADGGGSEQYLVPLALESGAQAVRLRDSNPAALLCAVRLGNEDGVLYDALYGEVAARELLAMLQAGASQPWTVGGLACSPETPLTGFDGLDRLPVRRSGAEQSNSSLIFGRDFILKFYRKLEPGPNPDCELNGYLAGAGFDGVPRFGGLMEYQAQGSPPVTLSMAQSFVPNQGDGWQWTLEELARYYERSLAGGPSEPPQLPGMFELAETEIADDARALVSLCFDAAGSLGRKTAAMHLALGAASADSALIPEAVNADYRQRLASEFREHAGTVFDALKNSLATLPDDTLEDASLLLSLRRRVLAKLAGLQSMNLECVRIRIHGDYHLGQVLQVANDYVILDFEGEPARPLIERRSKQLALKDVAGMLRSFSYAAQSALLTHSTRRPEDAGRIEPWARAWERIVSAAFLRAYVDTAAGAPFLPSNPRAFRHLLEVFLLDKALYELRYELNNRPAWVRIPLSGILSLDLDAQP